MNVHDVICCNFQRSFEMGFSTALLESPKSIIHAGIYRLTGNATKCMVIFHIGTYGIIYSATVAV